MKLTDKEIKKIQEYFSDKPSVPKAYLFGSYARGDADNSSDIDLMVEVDPDCRMGLDFFGLEPELKEKLRKEVDLTTVNGFHKRIRDRVMANRKLIYERTGS